MRILLRFNALEAASLQPSRSSKISFVTFREALAYFSVLCSPQIPVLTTKRLFPVWNSLSWISSRPGRP